MSFANLNPDQLFRELDAIKTICDKTAKLVEQQNGRVRSLEQKVFVLWWAWGALGAFLLAALPIVVSHFMERR